MGIDTERLASLRSYEDRELGIRETLVQPRVGGGSTMGVLSDDGKHEAKLRAAAGELPKDGGRVAFELIQTSRASGTNFPVAAQPVLIDILTTWMDQTLPGSSSAPSVHQFAERP